MDEWLTPQEAADMLGITITSVYTKASRFGWRTKSLGNNTKAGVLYFIDDVREELPHHGRPVSRWED